VEAAMKILCDDAAEACDFVVCIRADAPSPFADNLTGFCCDCGVKVQYRWHMPRQPKRLCLDCFARREWAQ
jgi:hypothetical protein